jgi:hypothetical protein
MTRSLLLATVTAVLCLASPGQAGNWIDCKLTYDLEGWAVFYKQAQGSGVVRCSNGQQASVRLHTKGGGFVLGKSEIVGGIGQFSKLRNISEVFGTYARAEVGAGAGNAVSSQVLTKGEVSLALAGKGRGVELGFAFGSFRIARQ